MTQRWAVIGTGTISRSVVPDLAYVKGVEVALVHSRDLANAEAFASEFRIERSTSDLDTVLLDPTIDVIYLATPFATHLELASRAIQAKKHVLVEKPIAMSEEQVAHLFTLASEHGVFLMEGMWLKFNPGFRSLLSEIANGTIGEPRNVRAGFSMPIPDDGGSKWDVNRSGGALLDQGIYPVTFAQSMLGTVRAVHASGSTRSDGLDLAEHFTLEFDDGRYAQGASGMTEFVEPSAAVSGTAGWIVVPAMFWASTTYEIHAGSWEAMMVRPRLVEHLQEGNGYVPMLRAVAEAIRAGVLQHPWHDGPATLAVYSTLDKIRHLLTH